MSEPIVWENLPKSQADATTIDEAIGDAIEVHNADSEAHMAALASLASHRDNPILDHPAESVYNDKLTVNAREYIGIVDPSSEVDFATIAAAVDYANLNGGGNILITPGEHFVSDDVTITEAVTFIGTNLDACEIHLGSTSLGKIIFNTGAWPNYKRFGLANITVVNAGGTCIEYIGGSTEALGGLYLNDCNLEGGENYVYAGSADVRMKGCTIACDSTAALQSNGACYLEDSIVTMLENGGIFRARLGGGSGSLKQDIIRSQLLSDGSGATKFWNGTLSSSLIQDSEIWEPLTSGNSIAYSQILNTYFYFSDAYQLVLSGAENRMNGCRIQKEEGTLNALNTSGNWNIITENVIAIGITQSGTDRIVANNITYSV